MDDGTNRAQSFSWVGLLPNSATEDDASCPSAHGFIGKDESGDQIGAAHRATRDKDRSTATGYCSPKSNFVAGIAGLDQVGTKFGSDATGERDILVNVVRKDRIA